MKSSRSRAVDLVAQADGTIANLVAAGAPIAQDGKIEVHVGAKRCHGECGMAYPPASLDEHGLCEACGVGQGPEPSRGDA